MTIGWLVKCLLPEWMSTIRHFVSVMYGSTIQPVVETHATQIKCGRLDTASSSIFAPISTLVRTSRLIHRCDRFKCFRVRFLLEKFSIYFNKLASYREWFAPHRTRTYTHGRTERTFHTYLFGPHHTAMMRPRVDKRFPEQRNCTIDACGSGGTTKLNKTRAQHWNFGQFSSFQYFFSL